MRKCPSCGSELSDEMIDANMCWECGFVLDPLQADAGGAEVAEAQRTEIKRKIYAQSKNMGVEYGVEAVITDKDGLTDEKELERLLNERANDGWVLKSAYSNKLGENAVRVLGFGINSTVSQAIYIFEREYEK